MLFLVERGGGRPQERGGVLIVRVVRPPLTFDVNVERLQELFRLFLRIAAA